VACTCLLIAFLIVGCAIDTIGIETQGLVSFVARTGRGVYKEFSPFSIAKLLMDDARFLGGSSYVAAYLFLAFVVLSSVFFVPFFQSLALLYHWFKPMDDNERTRFSTLIEILGAWQYAEVFILALFISAWYVLMVPPLVHIPFEWSLNTQNRLPFTGNCLLHQHQSWQSNALHLSRYLRC
jgi:hypothetical protein